MTNQLGCHLEIERAIPCDEYALSWRDRVTAKECLRSAGCHHTRESPSRHRYASFIGAGRHDEFFRSELVALLVVVTQEVVWIEDCPYGHATEDSYSTTTHIIDQGSALRELCITLLAGYLLLLEVLTTQ